MVICFGRRTQPCNTAAMSPGGPKVYHNKDVCNTQQPRKTVLLVSALSIHLCSACVNVAPTSSLWSSCILLG